MSKLLSPIVLIILIVAVIAEGALLAVSLGKINKLEKKDYGNNQQDQLALSMAALTGLGFSQPAVSVSENKVYLPELKIALPLDNTSLQLLYLSRNAGNPAKGDDSVVYDVTTRSLVSLSPVGYQQTKACYPVRLAVEDRPSAFNPHEKAASVKLTDGRTIQIYANQDPACDAQYQTAGVEPVTIQKTFEAAESY